MEKIYRALSSLTQKNNFSAYSAIFRIYLSFHVIKKIYLCWGSISLTSGDLLNQHVNLPTFMSFFTESMMIHHVPLVYYAGILISFLFMFGIGRFYTAIAFHILCRLLVDMNFMFSNGGDNILMFVSFYMIFINSYEYFCLNPAPARENSAKNFISNLGSYAIMIQLCFIYFVSAIHKIHADVWFNGVATYYVMNLERYSSPINQYLFKNAFIIAASTYFTLAFELFFPILVWNKKLRKFCLIAGLFMHLGIYFTMMIYDFEILFIMVYGFFISNAFWLSLINRRIHGSARFTLSSGKLHHNRIA